MFVYEKKLQYPVKIQNTNPKLAALIISQYGGPDGELGASLRYLSQRYCHALPGAEGPADRYRYRGTGASGDDRRHRPPADAQSLPRRISRPPALTPTSSTTRPASIPTAASGFPWNAASMAVKGDLIADLTEDLAAEQKARVTYDNILRLVRRPGRQRRHQVPARPRDRPLPALRRGPAACQGPYGSEESLLCQPIVRLVSKQRESGCSPSALRYPMRTRT